MSRSATPTAREMLTQVVSLVASTSLFRPVQTHSSPVAFSKGTRGWANMKRVESPGAIAGPL